MQSLRETAKGKQVTVFKLEGQPAVCHRLREMGFCESAEVTVLQHGSAMLCQVCGSRVGLSRELASQILVKSGK